MKKKLTYKKIASVFFYLIVSAAYMFTTSCIVDATDSTEEDADNESDSLDEEDGNDGDDSYDSEVSYPVSDTTVLYINLTDGTWSADNSEFTKISTSKRMVLTGVSLKYKTDDNKKSTGLVLINAEAAEKSIDYYLCGKLTTGGVKIKTNSNVTQAAKVYLTDVSILSSDYACLAITGGSSATVNLSGTNIFTEGRNYGTAYEYASKGTLFCKGSLTLEGTGSLSVENGYKNCIAAGTNTAPADLIINSGTYTLKSTGKSGLVAENVTINNGDFTFNGQGTVSTSAFHKTHGISSNGDVVINGGTLNLTAYNGKGITGDTVTITGGSITVDSSGVTGYASENRKTGTYYDADGTKLSNQSIVFAAEGIEGASNILVSGGVIKITAVDDAMNLSTTGKTVTISGGSIYAYSSGGDGIDSNGNIKISGGIIMTCAPTGSEDGLDCGDGSYSITVTGGLIGSCSGSSNASAPNVSGQKAFVLGGGSGFGGNSGGFGGGMGGPGRAGFGGNQNSNNYSGSTVVVLDSNNTVVYALEVPSVSGSGMGGSSCYSHLLLSSPDFKTSETYTVYTGATISGGESYNGLYTVMPSASSYGTEATVSTY